MKKATPATIDQYLATVSAEQRAALEKLRKTIRSIVPDAEECISYRMPAFRYDGQVIAGFCATAGGYSYYPFSGRTLAMLAAEVAGYSQTKSALHVERKRSLPATLVRKLLMVRITEVERRGDRKQPQLSRGGTARRARS